MRLPPSKGEIYDDLVEFIQTTPSDRVVVVELFANAKRGNKYQRYTTEVVGGVEAICHEHSTICFVVKNSRRVKMLPRAERMLAHRKHPKHTTDALAHLLTYMKEGDPY